MTNTATATQINTEIQIPKDYAVILINDDYTSMDFVIFILQTQFQKTPEEALALTLKIHHQGQGICGIYSKDIALSKQKKVTLLARENEFPLECIIEEA